MREPRPTQRFPRNGKALYEALRRDAEPTVVWVLSEEDERQVVVIQDYTLLWSRFFDPMLYFWPVERQHVCAIFWTDCEDKILERLVKALLRDGADWVTVSRPRPTDWSNVFGTVGRYWENYGDAEQHIQRVYGTVDPVAVPTEGSGPGGEGPPPQDSGGVPDGVG